ncbi:MAG: hydroxymethylbilane synthase [Chlamydiales bacterium]|nr:hydroxymethylbilane synthase [Chlamydiales bacterium]
MSSSESSALFVAARASKLSRVQVQEVLEELRNFHPDVSFSPIWIETSGDLNQTTSLRTLDKTDFFTREIDQLLLAGGCRVAIHSAKDLPDPLPSGLVIAAITRGVDSGDSLVLSQGVTLETLPMHAKIGVSSQRREETLLTLRSDLKPVDIRGTIEKRLTLIEKGEVAGVVVAEAALIRLGLTHLNRLKLPGQTLPLQGKLAVIVRDSDEEMLKLFATLSG